MPEPRAPGRAESAQDRLKRLAMRSARRGIREMDLILGRFAEAELARLDEDELQLYDALLSENDHDLYQWVTGQAAAPARFSVLVARIAGMPSPAP